MHCRAAPAGSPRRTPCARATCAPRTPRVPRRSARTSPHWHRRPKGTVNTHSEPPAERYLGRGADPFLYLAGCNMSVRRSALRRAGAFNPELPYCYEDVEVCMRLLDAGARIAWVEAALVQHERAASWLRDGEQAITDPYALMVSAAVFIKQSSPTSASNVLANWLATWTSEPAERVRRSGARGFASALSRGSRTVSAQGGDRGRWYALADAGSAATSSRTCRRRRHALPSSRPHPVTGLRRRRPAVSASKLADPHPRRASSTTTGSREPDGKERDTASTASAVGGASSTRWVRGSRTVTRSRAGFGWTPA